MSFKLEYRNGLPCLVGEIVHEGIAAPMTAEERAVLEAAEDWYDAGDHDGDGVSLGTRLDLRQAVASLIKARGGK